MPSYTPLIKKNKQEKVVLGVDILRTLHPAALCLDPETPSTLAGG